jgi:hypothetical protein
MTKRSVLGGLSLFVYFMALTYSFTTNGFGVAPWNEWAVWEQGSEVMVLKRIEVDLLEKSVTPLGLANYVGDELSVVERLNGGEYGTPGQPEPPTFIPYESEIGGQAHFWSFVWQNLGCSSISCLHAANSALTAASVLGMYFVFTLIGSRGLAIAWLISSAASPWVAFGARNLFWSPWMYFVPAIATVGLVLARSRRSRILAAAGVFLAFITKFVMTGYHEISSFVMLAAAIPIIAILVNKRDNTYLKEQLRNALVVVASAILAFAMVISLHAYILTGNVISGLRQIWINAVLRRSYGDPENYSDIHADSLNANPLNVLWRYVWSDWWTDLLSFSFNRDGSLFSISLGSASFVLLSLACILFVVIRMLAQDRRWIRDSVLLIIGFAIPAIWLMAAKAYANEHIFILFFLWYWLYVPVLIFVTTSFLWDRRRPVVNALKNHAISRQRDSASSKS